MGRSATPVRHKWHLRLSLNGPRGDGGDGFERHRKEEEGASGVICPYIQEGGRGGDRANLSLYTGRRRRWRAKGGDDS